MTQSTFSRRPPNFDQTVATFGPNGAYRNLPTVVESGGYFYPIRNKKGRYIPSSPVNEYGVPTSPYTYESAVLAHHALTPGGLRPDDVGYTRELPTLDENTRKNIVDSYAGLSDQELREQLTKDIMVERGYTDAKIPQAYTPTVWDRTVGKWWNRADLAGTGHWVGMHGLNKMFKRPWMGNQANLGGKYFPHAMVIGDGVESIGGLTELQRASREALTPAVTPPKHTDDPAWRLKQSNLAFEKYLRNPFGRKGEDVISAYDTNLGRSLGAAANVALAGPTMMAGMALDPIMRMKQNYLNRRAQEQGRLQAGLKTVAGGGLGSLFGGAGAQMIAKAGLTPLYMVGHTAKQFGREVLEPITNTNRVYQTADYRNREGWREPQTALETRVAQGKSTAPRTVGELRAAMSNPANAWLQSAANKKVLDAYRSPATNATPLAQAYSRLGDVKYIKDRGNKQVPPRPQSQ